MNTYDLSVNLRCPVDQKIIKVQVTLETHSLIEVENLLFTINRLRDGDTMQEPFTDQLHNEMGCSVKTVATHSGVKITCVRGEI